MTQLPFYLQLLVILASTTLLAVWCGWGVARLALPLALQPYRGLLAPLLGFVLLMVVGYWVVRTVAGIWLALVLLLPVTAILNGVAWRREGPPRLLAPLRDEWPLTLLLLATLFVNIAPLLHYGRPAVIGGGWDIETALPTARYLGRGPISAIASAPENPLRDLVSNPPRIGKTVGFAVWQSALSTVIRIEEILTFTPLLAWLRVLGVLASYILFRATLGLRRGPALLGAAWTSAGALMLWISYFNFEKQMASWALIPLGLILSVAAVEDIAARGWRAWPVLLMAAIGISALPVAYYPALTLWVPLAVGLAVAILIAAPNRLRLLGAAIALMLATMLVSVPAIIDYWEGFAHRYDEQLTSLGLSRYIPITDILGLTPYIQGQRSAPPPSLWVQVGLVAFVGLSALAVLLPTKTPTATAETSTRHVSIVRSILFDAPEMRLRWLGMAVGVVGYLAWLRWSQNYAYAYMKGAAYAGFVCMGLAAAGWQALASHIALRLRRLAIVLPLLLFVPLLASQLQIVRLHWDQPGLYPDDFPTLLALRQLIPAGSTVTLTDNLQTEGVISGLAAYMLDHSTVWGHVKTGYTSATTGPNDGVGEYALLPTSEDPLPWGYRDLIWSGGSYALYRRPPDVLAQLRPEKLLRPGDNLPFSVGGEHLAQDQVELPAGPARQIELTLATMQDAALSIDGKTYAIPAGATQLYLASVSTGRTLELRNSGAVPVLVRAIALASSSRNADTVVPLRASFVTSTQTITDGQRLVTHIESRLPDGGPLTVAIDIWDSRSGTHYGWYGFTLSTSTQIQTATLTFNPLTGVMDAVDSAGSPIALGTQFAGLQAGAYSARLQVSAGAALLTPPAKVFGFSIDKNGAASRFQIQTIPILMTTTDRPPHPLNLQVGDDIELTGYVVDKPSAHPGEDVALTLWWAAQANVPDQRAVLVHLLDSTGAIVTQADGPPVAGMRPTETWQAGEHVIDTHHLALPTGLPSGEYTLAFGMYRWPSLERLMLRSGDIPQPDNIVRVPIRIVR